MGKIPFPEEAWPRLKAALELVAAEPSRLYMPFWVTSGRSIANDTLVRQELQDRTGGLPPCGTAACLAGWVGISHKMDTQGKDLPQAAREVERMENPAAYALKALGLRPSWRGRLVRGQTPDPIAEVFEDADTGVFYMTEEIKNYADLRRVLLERFTFPEPLPRARRQRKAVEACSR